MTVWYSSYNNDVMSDRAHEEYFESLVEDWMTQDNFSAFLEEKYYTYELFEFTDSDRATAREEFYEWAREKAEDNDVYEAFEVRLASEEEEE